MKGLLYSQKIRVRNTVNEFEILRLQQRLIFFVILFFRATGLPEINSYCTIGDK